MGNRQLEIFRGPAGKIELKLDSALRSRISPQGRVVPDGEGGSGETPVWLRKLAPVIQWRENNEGGDLSATFDKPYREREQKDEDEEARRQDKIRKEREEADRKQREKEKADLERAEKLKKDALAEASQKAADAKKATDQATRDQLAKESELAIKKAADIELAESRRKEIRDVAKDVIEESPDRVFEETSGYRENSDAHRNGAIDVRIRDPWSPEPHAEAIAISERLGKGANVLVEIPSSRKDADGKALVTYFSYQDGQLIKDPYDRPGKADAAHIHIQPTPDRWSELLRKKGE